MLSLLFDILFINYFYLRYNWWAVQCDEKIFKIGDAVVILFLEVVQPVEFYESTIGNCN